MSLTEAQLETWSKQGSITQSASTYATVKRGLESPHADYPNRNFRIFLQGSYANDTNIFAESDVDVVMLYEGAFFHDLEELTTVERTAFAEHFSDGVYPYAEFKNHVHGALDAAFEGAVTAGNKVLNIAPTGNRRNADVVVAFEFRRYFRFNGAHDQQYESGICFFRGDGVRIANYPRQHSANCSAKHQATGENFKPMIRLLKNLRGHLVERSWLADGIAPSYFLEALLYNVPDDRFTGSYSDILFKCLNWWHVQDAAARDRWVCVNEQYFLLRDDPVCWSAEHCEQFITAAIRLWNG